MHHILLVEDSPFDAEICSQLLRDAMGEQVHITTAVTGEAFRAHMQVTQTLPTCILLDMNLPDTNGHDLLHWCGAHYPNIPVIIITGDREESTVFRTLLAGAEDYLVKGDYTSAMLSRAIRYAIQRKQAEMATQKLRNDLALQRNINEQQQQFISLVSHEFRTPLAMISSAVQLLEHAVPSSHITTRQFDKIHHNIARITQLMENVLMLYQLDSGKLQRQFLNISLQNLFNTLSEMFDEESQVARLEFHSHATDRLILGDSHLLECALRNIIENALKYSPVESKVHVTLRVDAGHAHIMVEDHGCGIQPDMLEKLGKKFSRSSQHQTIEGTGLGLHLAQRFLEHHRATMFFCSQKNMGTTVKITIPLALAAQAAA